VYVSYSPEASDYIEDIEGSTSYKNPSCVDNLKAVLGLPSGIYTSLVRPILMTPIDESEYSDSLRKAQRMKWSMDVLVLITDPAFCNNHSAQSGYRCETLQIRQSRRSFKKLQSFAGNR
jgi:hypothetical protein